MLITLSMWRWKLAHICESTAALLSGIVSRAFKNKVRKLTQKYLIENQKIHVVEWNSQVG